MGFSLLCNISVAIFIHLKQYLAVMKNVESILKLLFMKNGKE